MPTVKRSWLVAWRHITPGREISQLRKWAAESQGAREAFLDRVPIPKNQIYVLKEGLSAKVQPSTHFTHACAHHDHVPHPVMSWCKRTTTLSDVHGHHQDVRAAM